MCFLPRVSQQSRSRGEQPQRCVVMPAPLFSGHVDTLFSLPGVAGFVLDGKNPLAFME